MQLPLPGQTFLGKYALQECIGRGGFAIVFRATEIVMGRDVAVKILLPTDNDGYDISISQRFMREARLLAELRSPHTVTMYDFGRSPEGLLYMVSEYLAGGDLAEMIGRYGGLGEDVAMHMLRQLCEALSEAHAAGVLHRDLKPGNILLDPYMDDQYRVKLIDFGIAKPLAQRSDALTVTRTGAVVGTPRYMSPEQSCGEVLTPASDIYSLGLVIYEAMTGERAVRGETARDILIEQLADLPLFLPHLDDVSPFTAGVIRKMVQRRVEARFRTAEEVLDVLYGDAPPPEYPAVPPVTVQEQEPEGGFDTTTKVLLAGGLLVALLAVGGLVHAIWSSNQRPEPAPEPPMQVVAEAPAAAAVDVPTPDTGPPSGVEVLVPDSGASDAGGPLPEPEVVGAFPDARPSEGCHLVPGKRSQEHSVILPPDGRRRWRTYISNDYRPEVAYPLIVAFDRSMMTGTSVFDEFGDMTNQEPFVVVGPISETGLSPWESATDVETVKRALEHTLQNYCIDESRIYAVAQGLAGRFVAQKLVCEVPFSAIAMGATAIRNMHPRCEVPDAPFMYLMGVKDKWHPVDGGDDCTGKETVPHSGHIEMWKERYGCDGEVIEYSRLPEGRCDTWTCDTKYVHCTVAGGYHWRYTGTELQFLLSGCKMDRSPYPYGDRIWRFFKEEGVQLPAPER